MCQTKIGMSFYTHQICVQCGHYLTDYEIFAQYAEQGLNPLCWQCANELW